MKYALFIIGFFTLANGSLPLASKKMRVAVARGKIHEVRNCLRAGQSPLSCWPKGGGTLLMMAVRWGRAEIAQLLANYQLPEQARIENHNKRTALHFAADAGNIEIMGALLEVQADINHLDENNIPPLFAAVQGMCTQNKPEHLLAFKLLWDADAYPFPEEQKLWDLVQSSHNQEIIDLLTPYFCKQKIG